jgi:hypothetical protein
MKRVALILVLTSLSLHGAPAGAQGAVDEKSVCIDAVTKGQPLRDAHELVEAREQFRVCARAECPARLRTDCAAWLSEIDKTMPTVVLSAKDQAGRDVADVKVSVDGKPLVDRLDGRAVEVDPGMRSFRFERSDGSSTTQEALVKEGEKARSVSVSLSGASHETNSGESGSASTPWGTARTLGVVLGGVGVATLAVGFGVAFDAKSKDDAAKTETGAAQYNNSGSAVGEGNAATVVLGVGAAAAVTGVVLWLTAPHAKTDGASSGSAAPGRSLGVATDGRVVVLRGTFW